MTRKLLALASIVAVALVSAFVVPQSAGATAPSGDASQLYVLTNQARSAWSRPWLGWDQGLANTAQDYANYLASSGVFAHDVNLYAHAGAAVPGLSSWGENIAYQSGSSDPIVAMQNNYMNSAGHRNNILGAQYDRVGIGIAYAGGRTYSVVRFAASANKTALGQSVGGYDSASSPAINTVRVKGWALDPDSTGAVTIDVRVNGAVVATRTAGGSRTDIGNVFEGFGSGHGFDVSVNTIGGSTKSVCVEVRNLAGYGGTVSLGCKNVAVVPDLSGPFYDVSSTHSFLTEIAWLENQGITSGYSDGTFRPGESITRESMATFLWRYSGQPAPAPGAPIFKDVPAGSPFATAIRWMAGEGIASGYSDGSFRGSDPVSRQAAASFFWKLAESPTPPGGAPTFSDVPVGNAFRTPISWAASAGVATGYSDGTFHPTDVLSRQGFAAFLYRYDHM